jgi:dGTP triphosphohydrolase
MMRTSIEKMATYIGTKFGDDAAQEWVSNKKTILPEPTYSQAILNRHTQRVRATKDRIELKLRGLTAEKAAIEAEIQVESSRTLLRELREVDDQIAKCNIELSDEVEMKLTKDEKIAHSNAWRTHREATESLKKSRGKIYSLLIGQCTQVLVDKMKQDSDWVTISESFDPILLLSQAK